MKAINYILPIMFVLSVTVNAQTNYYVDDNLDAGDVYTPGAVGVAYPGNDGLTPTTPVNNVQDIIDNYSLSAGDTVFIDVGTYIDQYISASGLTGAAGMPIVFLGVDSSTTIFTNSDPSDIASFTLDNTKYTVWKNLRSVVSGSGKAFYIINDSDFNEISFCRSENAQYAIDLLSVDDVLFPENNKIHDSYLEGVYVALRIKADRSRININTGQSYSWVEVSDYAPRNNEIYDNVIINNAATSGFATIELHAIKENFLYRNKIVMNSGITADGIIFLAHGVSGNIMTNNYLINLSSSGTKNYGVYIDDTFDYSVDFQHNSIYTMDACFYSRQAANGFTFNNNILYSVLTQCMKMDVGNTKLGECINNYYYFPNGVLASHAATNITSLADWKLYNPDNTNNAKDAIGGSLSGFDPLFEDPTNWNLDLQCGSQAMDASYNPLLSVVDDIHKAPRPQGLRLDIGGFEGALVEAGTFVEANQRICNGSTTDFNVENYIALSATWQESADGINWGSIGTFATINADTSITSSLVNLGTSPDSAYFRMYVSGICNSDTTDVATLIVDPTPDYGDDIAGTRMCIGGSHQIYVENELGNQISWQSSIDGVVWSNTGLSGDSINIAPSITTNYRALVAYAGETCVADTSNVALVEVGEQPIGGTISGSVICPGDQVIIRLNGYVGDSIYWEESEAGLDAWSVVSGADSDSLVVNPSVDMDYRAIINYGGGTCLQDSTNETLVDVELVDPTVTIQLDGNPVCEEGGSEVHAYVSNMTDQGSGPTFDWLVNGISSGEIDSVFDMTNPIEGDIVCLNMISNSSCATMVPVVSNCETIVTQKCDCDVFIPSGFSPNQDNNNDLWQMRNLECYSDVNVWVYNRWGSLVFESLGSYKEWDGTINGKTLPMATYYYIVELDGTDQRAGSVTIVK